MFKKIIKIILILLAIFLLILGIIWLIGRHKATQSGSTPLSFRQFLGLGTKTSTVGTTAQQTGSSFGNGTGGGNGSNSTGTTTGTGASYGNGTNQNYSNTTNTSQFTNGSTNPTGNYGVGATGYTNSSTSGLGNNTGTTNNSNNTASGTTTTSTTGSSAPVCSTADTTITFTTQEIAELNTLQNEFYALASTLHTDSDVSTEIANHDAFALKADQVTELYNYCESKIPLITDPRLQQHVPTPFWHQWLASDVPANTWNTSGQADQDSWTFIDFTQVDPVHLTDIHDHNTDNPDTSGVSGPYGLLSLSNPGVVNISGSSLNSDQQLLVPVVERILRINLW